MALAAVAARLAAGAANGPARADRALARGLQQGAPRSMPSPHRCAPSERRPSRRRAAAARPLTPSGGRHRMRTFVKTVLVGAPLLLASAADAEAQRLQLVPRAGIFVSGGNLAEVSGTLGDVEADMKGTLGVGLGLEVGVPLSPIGFRAGFDYATNSKLSLKGISAGEDEAGAKLLAVTGDVVLRPLPRLIVVQPYLVGGAGVKRYDFELSELEADAQGLFPEDQTDFTLHGGA